MMGYSLRFRLFLRNMRYMLFSSCGILGWGSWGWSCWGNWISLGVWRRGLIWMYVFHPEFDKFGISSSQIAFLIFSQTRMTKLRNELRLTDVRTPSRLPKRLMPLEAWQPSSCIFSAIKIGKRSNRYSWNRSDGCSYVSVLKCFSRLVANSKLLEITRWHQQDLFEMPDPSALPSSRPGSAISLAPQDNPALAESTPSEDIRTISDGWVTVKDYKGASFIYGGFCLGGKLGPLGYQWRAFTQIFSDAAFTDLQTLETHLLKLATIYINNQAGCQEHVSMGYMDDLRFRLSDRKSEIMQFLGLVWFAYTWANHEALANQQPSSRTQPFWTLPWTARSCCWSCMRRRLSFNLPRWR